MCLGEFNKVGRHSPPLKCPSAYVTLVQNMTWSKKWLSVSLPCFMSCARVVSRTWRRKASPERPLVQLKIRNLDDTLRREISWRWILLRWILLVTHFVLVELEGEIPTPGETNHCMQHTKLSTVCAPSRYQVKFVRFGSSTVWHRPGHLVPMSPSLNKSGRKEPLGESSLRDCKKDRARATARVAFCFWWVPAKPTKWFNDFALHVVWRPTQL